MQKRHRLIQQTAWFALSLFAIQAGNFAQAQPKVQSAALNIPGAVFNSQINSQRQMWQQEQETVPETHGIRDDIIFTDRFKRPISQQEFMYEIQRHHAEIYNNSQAQTPQWAEGFIEPPPPEDASFR